MQTRDELNDQLLVAARARDGEKIKKLLKEGASPSVIDPTDGNTPLHIAAYNNDQEIIKLLLNEHAVLTIRNKENNTPMMILAEEGYWGSVILLAYDKDTDKKDDAGYASALLIAVNQNKMDVTESLLLANAKPTWFWLKNGNYPLHIAVIKNNPAMVALLVAHNAQLSVLNKAMKTPVDLAVELKYWDCLKAICFTKQTKVESFAPYAAALRGAILDNQVKFIETLLKTYPNLKKSVFCKFPEDIYVKAIQHNNPKLIQVLIREGLMKKNDDKFFELSLKQQCWQSAYALHPEKMKANRHLLFSAALQGDAQAEVPANLFCECAEKTDCEKIEKLVAKGYVSAYLWMGNYYQQQFQTAKSATQQNQHKRTMLYYYEHAEQLGSDKAKAYLAAFNEIFAEKNNAKHSTLFNHNKTVVSDPQEKTPSLMQKLKQMRIGLLSAEDTPPKKEEVEGKEVQKLLM